MDPEELQPSTGLTRQPAQSVDILQPVVSSEYALPGLQEPLLRHYWWVLLKRRWTVLTTVVILVTLVTIASFRMTPEYEALSRIAVNRENNDVLGFRSVTSGSSEDWDYTVQLSTQVRVLQSDTLALQVIRQLQLDKNPLFAKDLPPAPRLSSGTIPTVLTDEDRLHQDRLLGAFRSKLAVAMIPRSRMIEVRYMSPDPKLAAQIANSLVEAFIEYNFKTRYESTMQTSNWISNQLVDLQRKVETSQEQLVRYQKENEILGLDEKQNITTAKLSELNEQLTLAETDRIQKQANYELTLSANPELIPGVTESRVIQKLKEQEADVRNEYAQATTQFGPSYPKVVELSNQLKQIEASYQAEVKKIAGRIRNAYLADVERERMLRAALDKQKQEANKLNERAIQYNLLKRDVETNRQLYEGLLQKLKEAGVSAGLRSGNVSVVDVARTPISPAKPNIPLNILLGFLASLGTGIALAFVQESLDNTVRAPEDVGAASALPALGVIPLGASRNGLRRGAARRQALARPEEREPVELMAHLRPRSEIAESYRALRTSILLSSPGGPPRIILVTSGLPQEGKTTTSINLALVLAQKGGRILLVDADLRRPGVHRYLKMKGNPGLSDLLAGNASFEDLVHPSVHLSNLAVLPAGITPPYPAELLASSFMRECLRRWKEQYDHVVIDTPPALTVTDAVLLSKESEAVVVVIRAGQTTKEALRRTRNLLSCVNSRTVGVVLNAVDLRSHGHYYYGGYYEGYGKHYYTDEETQSH